ncbi:unnamed protein product [Pylaiella littoralis]
METDGAITSPADPPTSLEVPAADDGSPPLRDTAEAADIDDDLAIVGDEPASAEGYNSDEAEEGGEGGSRRRAREEQEEEKEGKDGEEEGAVKDAPHEYPTGVIQIEDQDMLPAANLYERWTATPGVPGEPLENVTLTLEFEAMGAQDLTVGLASTSGGKGAMYQLIIGNKGNLQADLEKRQGRDVETVASSAGLLCASERAHRYWVAVRNGRVDFGVGDDCGQRTVLSYQDADSPIEVRYVGFTCLRHRAVFRDAKMEAVVGNGPLGAAVETELEFVRAEGCDEGFSGEDKASLDAALEQYQRECETMKRRARKFGGAYSPPFLQDWVPWTIVKRLSWNRDKPMEGGIDSESQEERQKRKLRAERFGGSEIEQESGPPIQRTPLAARVDPDVAEMMTEEKRFARSQKFNITDQMWSIQAEEQGLRPKDIFCPDPDRADPEPMATTFPHKIHIFSLDKTVCKQIRDNDVKAYFEGFGPKYVEWLSDWSFNVVFGDTDEAKNAAAAKSFALPETLSKEIEEAMGQEEGEAVANLGAMGWRLGVPMCKVMRDRFGPKGQWVRLLLRCAEAQDILLARPSVPAKPGGPVVRRPGGGRLPPAVRAAQGLRGGDGGGQDSSRAGGKRRRGGGNSGPEVMMGQALKAPRTSISRNRRRGGDHDDDVHGNGNSASVPSPAATAAAAAADDDNNADGSATADEGATLVEADAQVPAQQA